MSTQTQKNVMNVMVAKDVSGTAISSISSNDLLGTMADGQVIAVGIPTGGGSEVVIPASASAGSYESFRLVESQGGVLNFGPRIQVSTIRSAAVKTYSAPQEQIAVIGFDGTSGNLDVTAGNEFILTVAFDHDDVMWSEQKLRNSYDYYSAAPTLQGLATSMVTQINFKEKMSTLNGTGATISAVMLTNGTATALDGPATLAVTNGSTTITASAAQTTDWSVGTLVRIGGAGATNPVYVITSVTSPTVATINTPYQGATNSAIAARTITVPTAFGIQVTGLALTWVKDFFKFMKVKFHFDLKGFGSSTYNTSCAVCQNSSKGVGSAYEVAEYESFAAGNDGALNRTVVPLPLGRTYADTSTPKTYDTIVIEADNTSNYSPIVATTAMRTQQFVFIPASAAVRTKLKSQLDTLLGVSL